MSFWNLDHLGAVLDDSFVSFLYKGLRTAFKSGHNIIFIQDMDVFVSSDLDNTSHIWFVDIRFVSFINYYSNLNF